MQWSSLYTTVVKQSNASPSALQPRLQEISDRRIPRPQMARKARIFRAVKPKTRTGSPAWSERGPSFVMKLVTHFSRSR